MDQLTKRIQTYLLRGITGALIMFALIAAFAIYNDDSEFLHNILIASSFFALGFGCAFYTVRRGLKHVS